MVNLLCECRLATSSWTHNKKEIFYFKYTSWFNAFLKYYIRNGFPLSRSALCEFFSPSLNPSHIIIIVSEFQDPCSKTAKIWFPPKIFAKMNMIFNCHRFKRNIKIYFIFFFLRILNFYSKKFKCSKSRKKTCLWNSVLKGKLY